MRRWNLNDETSLRASKTYTNISTTGDVPTLADVGVRPGFVYADAYDRFFLWGNNLTVFVLDPNTMVWTRMTGTGDNPGIGLINGTYGRFRYSPTYGVFVLVNSITSNVHIYKPSLDTTTTPPPPPNPTNNCSATLPSCNGVSCSLTYNPTSVNQSWVQNSLTCGFSCTNGYSGLTCSTPGVVTPPPNPLPLPPPSGKLPAWVNALPLWQWHAIPNTALSSVEPSVRRLGITGPSSKITTWNGAALKRSGSVYMLGAAGGHGDYAGNEVDAIALNTENPRWVELRASSVNADITDKTQFYLDKRPAATHTYYTTQFIDSLDRMIVFGGGGLNGLIFPRPPVDSPYFGSRRSFSFNMATNEWDLPDYIAQYPGSGDATAALAVKHPITGDFYYSRSYGDGWYRWSPASNTWTKLSGTTRAPWYT